jgi:hypothetical protein
MNYIETSNEYISKNKLEKLITKEFSPEHSDIGDTTIFKTSTEGKIVLINKKKYNSTFIMIEATTADEVRTITDFINKAAYENTTS